jgi:hypothetical protein
MTEQDELGAERNSKEGSYKAYHSSKEATKLREKVAERLTFNFFVRCLRLPKDTNVGKEAMKEADFLFSLIKEAGYVQLDEDQGLPDIEEFCQGIQGQEGYPYRMWGYRISQQDVLKAGWRKVII